MALVVQVEEVARKLGLPQPLDEADRWVIEEAIRDAQSDLEAYLGRPVTTATYTEHHMLPVDGKYHLTHYPVVSITSTTAEVDSAGTPTGYFTVVYVAGLDGAHDPELEPIRRFIRTHAIYSPDVQRLLRRLVPDAARKVRSLGVEGQNVTYDDVYATASNASELGLPGALPTLQTCDRWRLAGRRVHEPKTLVHELWPYSRACRDGWWW